MARVDRTTRADGAANPVIIDAHVHVVSAGRSRRNTAEGGPARLSRPYGLPDVQEAQPRPMPIVLVEADRADPDENARLMSIARQYPLVLAVIGRLDLTQPGATDALTRIIEHPDGARWRGIRLALRRDVEDPWDAASAERTATLGMTSRVLELLVPYDRLAEARTIAERAACTVVVDHLGLPPWFASPQEWTEWEAGFVGLASVPHVVTKFCAVPAAATDPVTTARVARAERLALDHFGPDRLMYGSNWPWPTPGEPAGEEYPLSHALRLATALGPTEGASLLGGTARRVYAAPGP